MRSPARSVFGRVVFVGLAAGLLALGLATIGTAWVIGDDKEATLVDQAIRRAERSRDGIAHRVALAQAELRAVALSADGGQILDAPSLLSGTAIAMRCLRGDDELLDASSTREARAALLAGPVPEGEGAIRAGRSRVIVASHVGALRALALYDLSDLTAAPRGWTIALSNVPEGALVAKRYQDRRGNEQVRVVAPAAAGLGVTVTAPLAPARSAAFAITRRIGLFASLTVIPLLILAWFMSRAVTSPIVALAEAVRKAEGRNLEVPPLPAHEVGDLGAAIGAMSARLHDNATALHAAITLGRRLEGLHGDEALLGELERSLRKALPGARWTVLSAQRIVADENPSDLDLGPETLRALLQAAAADPGRDEGRTQPLLVHGPTRSPTGHREVVVVAVSEAGQTRGLVIGSSPRLDSTSVQHAELFARTAATALRREELLRSALTNEKLVAVGRLAAGVAHEMNNPLAFVLANLHGLESSLKGDDREAATEARQGAERLARIVRDLSSLSKGGTAAEPEPADLAELAAFTVRIAGSRRAGFSPTVDAPSPVPVRVDRGRIEQILVNLLANAIDATRERSDARVELSVRVEGEDAVVRVSDNGPGIPTSVRDKLFAPFFTTKGAGGTGLGLYLSRSLAQANGGDLTLASTGPEGTTFVLRLPVRQSVLPAAPSTVEKAKIATNGSPRVLIVDDEPAIVRGLKRWIGTRAEVVGTTDPREALELASREAFALVLCDLNMPFMSGLDLLTELRARAPATAKRVVIMTGSTNAATIDAGVRVVGKPIGPALLQELLDAM